MLISIVTGTYNRLYHLQRMIETARHDLVGLDYEFVIVDGGSADGTIAWCQAQSDIRLIEQGELLGALRAFTDGGNAAHGEYVLLANDDVTFNPYSILSALSHLLEHPTCGAVAFADDRPAPGYGEGYKVQVMTAHTETGTPINAPYAQVGLFRRDLGNRAGWWGADDEIMGQGHTYGGDNYLSARILEMGYSVDEVELAQVHDNLLEDELRKKNYETERQNSGVYYRRFPHGPMVPNKSAAAVYDKPLRIIYVPIYERGFGKYKTGLRDALKQVGIVYEIDAANESYDLEQAVKAFKPDLLLLQCTIPLDMLIEARKAHPAMVVVNWYGDVHRQHLTSATTLRYLEHVDLQLTVNQSVLAFYAENNIPAAYWQVAFEPVDYNQLPPVPKHDIVFLANCYSPQRRQLGRLLQSIPGANVGLYGMGWPYGNGNTTYDFRTGAALYRNAKIAIGDNQYPDETGFISNRVFEALASGAFLLHQHVEGLEELTGLQDGVHYIAWTDEADLQQKIKHWLKPRNNKERQRIAQTGCEYVHANHNFNVRVNELFDNLIPQIAYAVT